MSAVALRPPRTQGYNNAEQPDEQELEACKERMAQMEAVLMSAIAHENIVRTHKVGSCTPGWDGMGELVFFHGSLVIKPLSPISPC